MTKFQLFKIGFKKTPIQHYFDYWFWEYLLKDTKYSDKNYCSYLNRILCRYANHPSGVWWFNSCSSEPDMCCKECGEDLG